MEFASRNSSVPARSKDKQTLSRLHLMLGEGPAVRLFKGVGEIPAFQIDAIVGTIMEFNPG